MFNYDDLKVKMYEKKYTIKKLAEELAIKPVTLSKKLNSKVYFTSKELFKIANLLELTPEEYDKYFFYSKS